jgi:hypothetical protein
MMAPARYHAPSPIRGGRAGGLIVNIAFRDPDGHR